MVIRGLGIDLVLVNPFDGEVTEENKHSAIVAFFFLSFGYIGMQLLLTPVRIKTVTSILTTEQYADLNMVMMNISFIGVMLSLGSYEYLLRMLPGKQPEEQLGIIRVFIRFFGGINLAGSVIGVLILTLVLPDGFMTMRDMVVCGIGLFVWGHLLQRCLILTGQSELFKYRVTQFFYADFWFIPLVAAWWFLRPDFSFSHALTIWVGWMCLVAIVLAGFVPYRAAWCSEDRSVTIKEVVTFSLPLIPMLFGEWLFRLGDRWFLYLLTDKTETAFYMATMNIALIAYMVGQQLLGIMSPAFNGAKALLPEGMQETPWLDSEMRGLFSIMLRYSWLLSLVTGLAFCFTGPEIVTILLAKTYAPAANLLPWAAAVSFFFLTATVFCRTLIALDQTRMVAKVTLAAAILNVVLNAILVPRMQKEGAALATVLSLAFMAAFAGVSVKAWRWVEWSELKPWRLCLFAGLSMMGFVLATRYLVHPFLVLGAAGGWSVLAIFVSGCFRRQELVRVFAARKASA